MEIATEIEISVTPVEKNTMWGIFHHHLNLPKLDPREKEFVEEFLHLIDPHKEMEQLYEIQARKV